MDPKSKNLGLSLTWCLCLDEKGTSQNSFLQALFGMKELEYIFETWKEG